MVRDFIVLLGERVDIAQLPPKPAPQTGQPRPPSAPLELGYTKPANRREKARGKVTTSPAGEGPMLEWFYPDRTSRVIAGSVVTILGSLTYVTKDWINGESGLSWVDTWWLWLIVAPWPFVFLILGNSPVSAGADWLAGRNLFVKTYELIKVKVGVTSGGAAHELQVVDKYGQTARYRLGELQQNDALWDLVYNGLIHSVHVNGAETNQRARDYLLLDYPPTVKDI